MLTGYQYSFFCSLFASRVVVGGKKQWATPLERLRIPTDNATPVPAEPARNAAVAASFAHLAARKWLALLSRSERKWLPEPAGKQFSTCFVISRVVAFREPAGRLALLS